MPNLINVLRRSDEAETQKKMTDEERRKAVEQALKGVGGDGNPARGMDWGTCLVFSCEKDCCVEEGGKGAKECWREEVVIIQASI
jgi:pre-rRNA-processing protein TSR4